MNGFLRLLRGQINRRAGQLPGATGLSYFTRGKGKLFKLLKESWLSLTLILVILATVCTATFAWQVDQKQMPLTATSALVNVKLNLANNEESDPGVLNLTALQDGQTAYIPFKMQNVSNIQTEVNFRVLVKNADGEEIEDALADWEIAILDNGEPLERSEDGTSFVAKVDAAEADASTTAYTLQLKAAPDSDLSILGTEDAQLYVTADVCIPAAESVQE